MKIINLEEIFDSYSKLDCDYSYHCTPKKAHVFQPCDEFG